jgi:hypothetical protein
MSTTKEIAVRPSGDQLLAWSDAAGDMPLDAWLAELADEATAGEVRSWPVAITLRSPVDFAGQRITAIEVRRGKLGDLKGIKLGGGDMAAEQLMAVASRMCGQPMKVIESLDPDDAGEVMPLVLDFFATCLKGGKRR